MKVAAAIKGLASICRWISKLSEAAEPCEVINAEGQTAHTQFHIINTGDLRMINIHHVYGKQMINSAEIESI